MPQILDRIQFGRVRRQTQQRDVRRTDEVVRPMIARAVPDQHRLHVGFECPRQLGEEDVHDARVETRRDQPFGLARRGARRRQHIDAAVLRLPHGAGTRTPSGPDAGQRPLLAEPRFVFVEDFEPAAGMLRLDRLKSLAEFFLNSSCAAGSACRCRGRGTSVE